ncbi:ATP-binding cassette domain-containing protein, partial [Desulfovibrio sp. OttesenSCG-928-C14]|nr:ATP-binding cassette domain-containing protein [Desulfovibrio sp. OttesenSCG-928-C14]
MNACLSVRNLVVEREKNGAGFTLRVPFLDVLPGQVLAVVGHSGCGKSTLLDTLALILRPTRAEAFSLFPETGVAVDLAGASPARLAALRGGAIGYVLQSGGLLSFLSVRDNILLPGKLLSMPGKILERRLDLLAGRMGIADQLHKKPQHLSGGQRQRAAIARALVHGPGLV